MSDIYSQAEPEPERPPFSSASALTSVKDDVADLAAIAVAMLEFASTDLHTLRQKGELAYLTSKDSFVWAALATYIVEHSGQKRIEDIELQSAVYKALVNYRLVVQDYLSLPPKIRPTKAHTTIEVEPLGAHDIYALIGKQILTELQIGSGRSDLPTGELNELIDVGFNDLIARDLITDPIIEGAIFLAVIGLVPFNFVNKTDKGEVEYLKIRAALWRYERSRKRGKVETNINLEVVRIAKVLKAALTAGFHQIASGDDHDEPPTGGVVAV
jgi:hypothetical protein